MKTRTVRLVSVAALALTTLPSAWAADAPKPDFSGVWTIYRPPGAPAGPGRADTGAFPRDPPFTPEAKAKVAEYHALVEPQGLTPGGACVGYGMPSAMLGSGGYPMEWIQRPEQVTVIYEAHSEIRRIYIGGPAPNPHDLIPSRDGNSFAHWEGDTLVVETFGLKEAVDQASAHSDKAKIAERYSIGKDDTGRKVLTAEMTLTDPAFYTKPVNATKKWLAVENGKLLPYDCTEPQWEDQLDKLRQESKDKAGASADAAKKPWTLHGTQHELQPGIPMNRTTASLFSITVVTMALALAAPAFAHHSAAQFNFTTPKSIDGVIKEVRMANPHMRLILTVTDAKGTRDIEFEGHSLNNLYRQGWRPDSVKAGDKVTVTIAPRKDGEDGGYVTKVKTSDGKEF
ncbi:MAG: DUF6152 family protein [Gammaproteobacteria bacterium]